MPTSQPSYRGITIALIATSIWATTAIIISYLFEHYPIEPLTMAFWRDAIVGVSLWLVLRVVQPSALNISRRDLPFFLVYGFIGLAVFNGLWALSVAFNGAAVATVLAYSSPAFTVLLAWLILKESLTLRKVIAVLISLAGCVLVAKAYSPDQWNLNLWGIVTGLGTGLAFALYNLAGRWSAKRFPNAWTLTAYGFLFAALGLLLTQRPDTIFSLGTHWDGWLLLLLLAVPTILGYGLYTVSLRYLQASVAGLIASLEPVLTAIMAIIFLGEMLEPLQWLGAFLIFGAIVTVQGEQSGERNASAHGG
jgi:drug/metabolite transporter, DME family